jgi:hypothetical protein
VQPSNHAVQRPFGPSNSAAGNGQPWSYVITAPLDARVVEQIVLQRLAEDRGSINRHLPQPELTRD